MWSWDKYVECLPIDSKIVLCAYGFGSRAAGTHTEHSDHDVVLVISDAGDTHGLVPPAEGWVEIEQGVCNWNIYRLWKWIARLQQCELQVYMAQACPLMEHWHPTADLTLRMMRLKGSVSTEAHRHYRSLAKRDWGSLPNGQLRARKCVFYGLRDWIYGTQVKF
jgi:predicted nucleotidyltransferase